MELLKHFSLMNLANEQPFPLKSNTGQAGSEKGDVLLWRLPLLARGPAALRCVFQTPEVVTEWEACWRPWCWTQKIQWVRTWPPSRRTEVTVHPLGWWAWGQELFKMLSSRQTKSLAPKKKWWLLCTFTLIPQGLNSFWVTVDLAPEWHHLCSTGKRASGTL